MNVCKMIISTFAVRCFFRDSSDSNTGFGSDGGTFFTSGWLINDDGVYVQKYDYSGESESWLRKISCTGT